MFYQHNTLGGLALNGEFLERNRNNNCGLVPTVWLTLSADNDMTAYSQRTCHVWATYGQHESNVRIMYGQCMDNVRATLTELVLIWKPKEFLFDAFFKRLANVLILTFLASTSLYRTKMLPLLQHTITITVRACVRPRTRACMRSCVRSFLRATVRACVSLCSYV